MARRKRFDSEVLTEYQVHERLLMESRKRCLESCNVEELELNLLNSINAFLGHLDCCLSRLIDLEEKEGRMKDEKKANSKING